MRNDRYERVMMAVHRKVPDRVPWALWGHFPAVRFLKYFSWEKANRDGEESARAHIALLRALDYKMDLLKVTPFYRFMACHWGSKFHWENNDESPSTIEVIVKKTDDWSKLWVLDPKKELREAIRCVEILERDLYGMPFIYTIPSPIVQALHGVSEPNRVYSDMKETPDALKEGLEIITQTTIDFAKGVIDEGATGIFFGIGGGGDIWSVMTKRQLEEYALHYDQRILHAVKDAPIKLLHVCNAKRENPQKDGGLMEDGWFKNYSTNALNWDESSFTSLEKAKKIYGDTFCLVGGVDRWNTMLHGTAQQVEMEVKNAIERMGEGSGFIIGPGCTLNQETPLVNYNAVAKAVEKYGQYRR